MPFPEGMKQLLLLCLGIALAALPSGCALYSNASYAEWSGPGIYTGTGGTKRTVDGIDIWQAGTPPCTYQLLGIVSQSNLQAANALSILANMDSENELVKQAKLHGGDAIVFLGQSSQVVGYQGSYGNGAIGMSADTMQQKGVAVIKYLPATAPLQ